MLHTKEHTMYDDALGPFNVHTALSAVEEKKDLLDLATQSEWKNTLKRQSDILVHAQRS